MPIGSMAAKKALSAPDLTRSIGILTVVLTVSPGTRSGVFDGIPLSGMSEFVLTAAASILFFSQVRTPTFSERQTTRTSIQMAWLIVILVALIVKLSLYWWYPTTGMFESCHRQLGSTLDSDSCLPSFDNPPGIPSRSEYFDRPSSTVSTIDFGPMNDESSGISSSNWALGFVNSKAYDDGYFPWESDDLNIEYFPFEVGISGAVSGGNYESIRIEYVGEGTVKVGDRTFILDRSYNAPSTVTIELDSLTEVIRIDFRFSQKVTNSTNYDGPYATLIVTDNDGNAVRADQSTLFRTMRLLPDITIVLALGAWLLVLRKRIFTISMLVPIGMTVLAAFIDDATSIGAILPISLSSLVLGALLVGYLFHTFSDAVGVLISGLIVAYQLVRSEFEFVAKHLVPLNYVFPRLRGNDHLVYQAFTQEMLESGFLRGGESVFYFQPGIRYVYYVGHWLFGSGDVIPGIIILFGMFASIVFLIHTIREAPKPFLKLSAVGVFGLIVWWTSSHTVQTTIFGLSESGTWPLLIMLSGMYIRRHVSNASMITAGVMLGAIIWIRPNQGIAAMAWLLCFVLLAKKITGRKREGLVCVGSFGVMLILVPIHNVIFGNTLSFLPGGRMFTEHYGWTTILKVFTDETARRFIIEQAKGIMYLPSVLPDLYSRQLALAFALFALAYIMGIAVLAKRQSIPIPEGLLLQLLVLGQIAPFLSYSVYRYFPVHIIAIHLSVVLIGMMLLSGPIDSRPSTSEQALTESRILVS